MLISWPTLRRFQVLRRNRANSTFITANTVDLAWVVYIPISVGSYGLHKKLYWPAQAWVRPFEWTLRILESFSKDFENCDLLRSNFPISKTVLWYIFYYRFKSTCYLLNLSVDVFSLNRIRESLFVLASILGYPMIVKPKKSCPYFIRYLWSLLKTCIRYGYLEKIAAP